MIERFRGLAAERIARISNDWMEVERGVQDSELVERMLREAHTLKGEARMLGFRLANDVVHAVEEVLHTTTSEQRAPTPAEGSRVLAGLDLVGLLVQGPVEGDATLAAAVAAFVAGEVAEVPRPPQPTSPSSELAAEKPSEEPGRASPAATEATPEEPARAVASATLRGGLRVDQEQLDRLAALVNRVSRGETGRRTEVRALRRSLQPILVALPPDAAELLRPLDLALRRLSERISDDVLLLDEVVDNVEALRYRPVGELFEAYPRAARDVAAQRGKQVQVLRSGELVALDGEVLERIREPLVHLVRNAVDHGLETPEERVARGKNPVGTLWLGAVSLGNTVRIRVEDDGSGIDLGRIGRSAVRRGLLNEDEVEGLSPADVRELIFRPDFSTRLTADDVSGRGVGLDVVRRVVEGLGGTVSVIPRPDGPGTRFEVVVPLSTLLADVLLCRAGALRVALPVRNIQGLLHLEPEDVVQTPHGAAFPWRGELRPLADLGIILDQPRLLPAERLSVVVLELDEVVGGVAVEAMDGQRRAVVRPLGSLAAKVGPVRAAVPLEDGGLAVVPDVRELLREVTFRSRWRARSHEENGRSVRILVVDDSDFTRDMLTGILREMGHEVVEAPNGRIGLDRFREASPDLVFTDLDMPVLDGFGFVKALRAEGHTVPICVVSTHREPEYVERASELGADAYLVKADFDDDRLARTVQRLVGGQL